MKHWHRCQRWTRRRASCPFGDSEGHDPTPDTDSDIDFTVPAVELDATPIHGGGKFRQTVGVREPRLKPLADRMVASLALPLPMPVWKGDVVGIPLPEPALPKPRPAPRPTGGQAVRQIMDEARAAVAAPERAKFTAQDFAFLAKRQIAPMAEGLSDEDKARTLHTQMAEEAAAEALFPAIEADLLGFWEIVQSPGVLGVLGIPLVMRVLRLVSTMRPGLLGAPGRMDPARQPSQFKTSDAPRIQDARGKFHGRGVAPAPKGFAGTGAFFNAAERMRVMVSVSRRRVTMQ